MENEIKVGDFIRTKDGIIGIFKEIDEHCRHYGERLEDKIYRVNTEKNEYLRLTENDIVKHSPNLIDILECGDYVNGECVLHIDNNTKAYGEKTIITELNNRYFGSQVIRLATKEMIESISYKVKKED